MENKYLRIPYFDILRGIAIACVVGIHTFSGEGSFVYLCREALNIAVPLFFAISGYFMSAKIWNRAFMLRQVKKIYIPMLIWSLPYVYIYLNNGWPAWSVLLLMLVGGLSIFYFIIAIIQCYLLTPWIMRLNERFLTVAIVVSFLCVAFVTYLLPGEDRLLVTYAGVFPLWIGFYWLGFYFGRHQQLRYSIGWAAIITVAGLGLSCIESHYLALSGLRAYGIKPSSFLYSYSLILLLFAPRVKEVFPNDNFIWRFFALLGRASFGIYLVHCLFLIVLNRVTNIHNWGVSFLIILFVSFGFVRVIRILLPRKAVEYLGFY